MKKTFFPFTLLIFFLIPRYVLAQRNSLQWQIENIAKSAKGIVGFSILNLESRDTFNYNANNNFVMQSVMKFPIAMAVLNLVDKGKYKLNEKFKVSKDDLLPNTYSPLRDKYPNGTEIALSDLLGYMVSKSDNNVCDFLLNNLQKKTGNTQVTQDYIKSLGITGINIVASESDMAKAWEVQYTNWCKPVDMVHLLDIFYQGKALSKTSNDFLWKIMAEKTSARPNRIKGLLPKDAIVAHKAGSSGSNDAGLTAATNDVGIITLPNGKHLAIAVFVGDSKADEVTQEKVIAQIAKAAWDNYGGK